LRPDGTPRKLLDISKLAALGWCATMPLRQGLTIGYDDFFTRFGANES
jgi:GDP-L-fucose synthase